MGGMMSETWMEQAREEAARAEIARIEAEARPKPSGPTEFIISADLLAEIEDYLDNRADASTEGDPPEIGRAHV